MFHIIVLWVMLMIFTGSAFANILIQPANVKITGDSSNHISAELCGDLLSVYSEKPDELYFIDCVKENEFDNDQLVCEARYMVDHKYAEQIEKYLIERYGMGALRFVCCGWETVGKYGCIESEELRQINPNYVMSVDMYGPAEQTDESGKIYIEKDRSKIKRFIVIVSVHEI